MKLKEIKTSTLTQIIGDQKITHSYKITIEQLQPKRKKIFRKVK
ncbi:MAG: hypothetical protein ACLU4S_02485 [Clostridium perfringens]